MKLEVVQGYVPEDYEYSVVDLECRNVEKKCRSSQSINVAHMINQVDQSRSG